MRQVQWSDAALDDLEKQAVHIAKEDPAAAMRIAGRIRKTGNRLGEFATGHPGRVNGTYEQSVRGLPWIIAYARSEDDRVLTIVRVIHTSRNWLSEEWPE